MFDLAGMQVKLQPPWSPLIGTSLENPSQKTEKMPRHKLCLVCYALILYDSLCVLVGITFVPTALTKFSEFARAVSLSLHVDREWGPHPTVTASHFQRAGGI